MKKPWTWKQRPKNVEAFKWTGEPGQDVPPWFRKLRENGEANEFKDETTGSCFIVKLQTFGLPVVEVLPGEYIVKNYKNEIYSAKPDVFEALHEKVVN